MDSHSEYSADSPFLPATPSESLYSGENSRVDADLPDSDIDPRTGLEALKRVAHSRLPYEQGTGESFSQELGHYADLARMGFSHTYALQESADAQVSAESNTVSLIANNLGDLLVDLHNKARHVRDTYGIADAEQDLWHGTLDSADLVGADDRQYAHLLSADPQELVEQADDYVTQLLDDIRGLPDAYVAALDAESLDTAPTVDLASRYRSVQHK